MRWVPLFAAIFFNSLANILIKVGMNQVHLPTGDWGLRLRYLLCTPKISLPVFGGILCFALNLVAYSVALTRMNLSVAYPIMTSSCFLLIGLFTWLGLGERITLWQLVGMALILGGVWLISLESSPPPPAQLP